MRKKNLPHRVPAFDPDTGSVLNCGTVTPEMQDVIGSMERYASDNQEETEKFFREAVGKLFIAALEQMYQQQRARTF
jgi:hypothetical protein